MDIVTLGNETLIINPDTRVIDVPSDLVLGVETDNASERLYFQCPQIVGDNIDLSQFHIYIHYQNANNEKGKYLCDDVEAESDNITFSWLIKEKAVLYKGQTKFIVCAKKTETDTIVWNTTIATANVLEGLNVDEDIVQQNDDVIEQILLRLEQIEASGGTGDINNAQVTFTEAGERTNIESQETLATMFGKIKKWFSDLKTIAFTGSYNDLSNRPSIPKKTSELTNDSNFLTAIPDEYVTDTELEGKGYAIKTDIPKKLPNPNKLTFTGALSGEYDGSAPLSIEVPQGGGGGVKYYNVITLEEPVVYIFESFSKIKGCNHLFMQIYIPTINEETYTNCIPRIRLSNSTSWSDGSVLSEYKVTASSNQLVIHADVVLKDNIAYFSSSGSRLQYTKEDIYGLNTTDCKKDFVFNETENSGIYFGIYNMTYSFPIGTEFVILGY